MDKNNTVDLEKIFKKKKNQIFAIAQYTATEAMIKAQTLQDAAQNKAGSRQGLDTSAKGWTNRSMQAVLGIRSFVERPKGNIEWGLYHTVDYGIYLEIANDRKYELLVPVIRSLEQTFIDRVNEVMDK